MSVTSPNWLNIATTAFDVPDDGGEFSVEIAEGWRVVADNFLVRIEGDGVNHDTVRIAIKQISDAAWWADPNTTHTVLSRLPDYRLSKFQPCLPNQYALEVVGGYLLDSLKTVGCLRDVR